MQGCVALFRAFVDVSGGLLDNGPRPYHLELFILVVIKVSVEFRFDYFSRIFLAFLDQSRLVLDCWFLGFKWNMPYLWCTLLAVCTELVFAQVESPRVYWLLFHGRHTSQIIGWREGTLTNLLLRRLSD